MVAIGPVVVISVAARVQAKRVERATEAAKTYIDSVRSGKTPAPNVRVGAAPTATKGSESFLDKALPPSPAKFSEACKSILSSASGWSSDSGFYYVDLDKSAGCSTNSSTDLVIQAFRTAGDSDQGYRLGVRVYRADAFRGSGPSKKITKEQAALKGTLGTRDVPLVTMITDIAPLADNNSLSTWCTRLRGGVSDPKKNSGC